MEEESLSGSIRLAGRSSQLQVCTLHKTTERGKKEIERGETNKCVVRGIERYKHTRTRIQRGLRSRHILYTQGLSQP